MKTSDLITSTQKPLHHHVLEGLEHVVDNFGMYMAIAAMVIMAAALIAAGHI